MNSSTATGLSGKRILVVGASSGIGQSFAAGAIAAGAEVMVAARRDSALKELCAGTTAVPLVLDATDPAAGASTAAAVRESFGRLDLLVIAAGASPLHRVTDITNDDWLGVLQLNLIGAHRIMAACVPLMAPAGIIAAISSESVGEGRAGLAAYSASKAGLEQVMRNFRAEHPAIRFSTVVVGATFPTDIGNAFEPGLLGELFGEWVARAFLPTEMMVTDEVAANMLALFATTLSTPTVNVEEIVLRSPSPPAA